MECTICKEALLNLQEIKKLIKAIDIDYCTGVLWAIAGTDEISGTGAESLVRLFFWKIRSVGSR